MYKLTPHNPSFSMHDSIRGYFQPSQRMCVGSASSLTQRQTTGIVTPRTTIAAFAGRTGGRTGRAGRPRQSWRWWVSCGTHMFKTQRGCCHPNSRGRHSWFTHLQRCFLRHRFSIHCHLHHRNVLHWELFQRLRCIGTPLALLFLAVLVLLVLFTTHGLNTAHPSLQFNDRQQLMDSFFTQLQFHKTLRVQRIFRHQPRT